MPTKRFEKLHPEKRRGILAAALTEFAGEGYAKASINQIVQRAGISKGAMYYYFEDKEDLFGAVVNDALMQFMMSSAGTVQPVTDADGFWLEVRRLTRACVTFYREQPEMAALTRGVLSALQSGAGGALMVSYIETMETWTTSILALARAVGAFQADIRDDLALSLLVGLTQGFDLWLSRNAESLTEDEVDAQVDVMVQIYRQLAGVGG